MTREPDQILSEFIDAWNAGRRPQVNVYLALAPAGQRGELADELSRFLALAPEPAYSPEALDAVRAEAASLPVPLASLLRRARERTRVSVRELGSSLAQALGVSDEAKTAGYLDQLESGSLDPRGLSRRVLDALAASLGVARDQLEAAADRFALPVPPATAAGALWRAEPEAAREERADLELLADAMAAPAPEPWDQIDELFRGGR